MLSLTGCSTFIPDQFFGVGQRIFIAILVRMQSLCDRSSI
jgi:hypothetical protein